MISWPPCQDCCVEWDDTQMKWTSTLSIGQIARCSRAWDGSFWFFYCLACKRRWRALRGAKIFMRQDGSTDYLTDSNNDTESDSSESASL